MQGERRKKIIPKGGGNFGVVDTVVRSVGIK